MKTCTLRACHRDEFIAWLIEGGAVLQPPKVENEYVRFIKPTGKQYTIMCQRGGDAYIAGGEAQRLAEDFLSGMKVRWTKDAPLVPRGGACARKHNQTVLALAERDGWGCMYCGKALTFGTATIEHVVPKSKDGPTNLHNFVLACWECNQRVGDMSVAEKMNLMKARPAAALKQADTDRAKVLYHPNVGVQYEFPNARVIRRPGDGRRYWYAAAATVLMLVLISVLLINVN